MNQQQQLELLNSIMPDIAESGDAPAVLLKTAKAKNLAPAQLEKLAQCFNSCKTIVGLKKMANRGDSFSIVDVPALVDEYTSYKPKAKKEATIEKKASNRDMDDWTAALNAMNKAASANHHLPPGDSDVIRFSDDDWKPVVDSGSPLGMDVFDNLFEPTKEESVVKVASAVKSAASMDPAERYAWGKKVRSLQEDAEQLQYELREELNKQASIIIEAIKPDYRERWHEVAEDAAISMDKKAAAAAIEFVESRFKELHKVYSPAPDFEKTACTRVLARDRYGVLENMETIASLAGQVKEAAQFGSDVRGAVKDWLLEKPEEDKDKEDTPKFDPYKGFVQPTVKAIRDYPTKAVSLVKDKSKEVANIVGSMLPDDAERQKTIDEGIDEAAWRSAIDSVKLENPVIAAADPSVVERIMSTLRVLSPSLSKYPETLAPIVAASIETGGNIPIPMMMSVSAIEKNLAGTGEKRSGDLH